MDAHHYPTITLVGSTKFPEIWIAAQRALTLAGCIVHTVGLFGHMEGIDMSGPTKKMLDRMYLQKILTSDGIVVLNKDGYIGLGAWDEICFALAYGKLISFMEPVRVCSDELIALARIENQTYSAIRNGWSNEAFELDHLIPEHSMKFYHLLKLLTSINRADLGKLK